jgi:hypothetical protein
MNFRIPVITVSALLVASCNTMEKKPDLAADQLRVKLQASRVDIQPVTVPANLVERTKSKAIGNMVISSVVSSAVGSSGNPSSMQQFQNNVEVGQTLGQELQKALPSGNLVSSGNGADLALANKLADYFNDKSSSVDGKSNGQITVSIKANLWELGYKSMLTSSDYALNYDLRMNLAESVGDQMRPLKQIVCRGEAPDMMPLEQWKANDYQKVDAAIPDIVDRCFNLAKVEMGLN